MNFLKIFQKKEPTANETAAEIKSLESLNKTAQENIEKLSLSLENHRLEVLGGQGTRGTLESLKTEYSEAVETGKTIGIALKIRKFKTKAGATHRRSKYYCSAAPKIRRYHSRIVLPLARGPAY